MGRAILTLSLPSRAQDGRMARRKLSTGGRIATAGLSIGVAGALVGVMAVSDHTAVASSAPATGRGNSVIGTNSNGNSNAQPYDQQNSSRYNDDSSNYQPSYEPSSPQPHTRSGGS
jgi:hypothetical protein